MSRVLITGCSTGIGRVAAVALAERGHDVVATARRPESLSDLDVDQRLRLDVDDDALVQAAVEAAGEVDVLVNNAAWGAIGPIETIPLDELRAMYETNVFSVLRMLQAVVPGMRERGRVVAVQPAYTATAWAGNERWLGVDEPPWDELYELVRALDEDGQEGAAPPEDVVDVIIEAIEGDDPPLRMPVGDDTKEGIALRRRLDDREWEQLTDERRPFSW